METMNYTYKEDDFYFFKENLILGKHKNEIYSIPLFRVWEDGFIQTYQIGCDSA